LAGLGATYGNTDFGSIWIVISGVMNAVRNIWVFLPILIAAFVAAIFLLRPKAEKKAV
jgi:hypothetical protein